MRGKLMIAALAVAAVPMAVSGQAGEAGAASGQANQAGASKQRDESSRRVCQTQNRTGSRLGSVTRCGTKQEMANVREEHRRTVERVQSNRVSFEQ